VVGLSWIKFMVCTVPACEIGMWKEQSTVHGKSVLFCRFICVKLKKGGRGKIVSLLFMKAGGGVEVQFLSLLTLALDGGVWKTAHTTAFFPGKEHP